MPKKGKAKGKKKKLNEGYTEPADTLIWCFLILCSKQLEKEQLVRAYSIHTSCLVK